MLHSILVTGSTGFVGKRLVPALQKAFPAAQIHAAGSASSQTALALDLASTESVNRIISDTKPDAIIHLAAISHIPTAFKNPEQTWHVNLLGTLKLLNAVTSRSTPCTFLQIGSGDCYGDSFKQGIPVTEDTPFKPLNPYAASKAAADIGVFSYCNTPNLKLIRARPFNHTGPGQSNQFVISAFAEQIAKIEASLQPPVISVGDLSALRCFLHVDDIIDAYIRLLKNRESISSGSAFNIASDTPVSIKSILNTLLSLSQTEISVETDPERLRPTDIPVAQADSSLLKHATGWSQKTELHDTLEEVLDFWRNHYKQDN